MNKRKVFEDKVKHKLQDLEKEVDRLKDEIKNDGAKLLPEHLSKMESLHAMMDESREKFHELVDASDEAFEGLQEGMEHYWIALGNELKAYQGESRK